MSEKISLPFNTVVRITKNDQGEYLAITTDGKDVTSAFEGHQLRRAVDNTGCVKLMKMPAGGAQWRNCPISEFTTSVQAPASIESDHSEIVAFIKNSPGVRPVEYKMSDVKWKFAVRSVLRGKNIMVTGPKGTGKTVLAFTLAQVLDRPLFNIPLGSTQDPRSVIIGNTHFATVATDEHAAGTFTALSYFAKAIQTPNALILLDELTRAHPDAWNLLMPVLDQKQRFLRVDEDPNTPTIRVADGVTFIATANIGSQYTATRVLDGALADRFSIVEVEPLGRDDELALLREKFADGVEDRLLQAVVNIAVATRVEAAGEESNIPDGVSTRTTIELTELLYDGFSLVDALEVTVYPQYSDAGGASSPRAFVRKMAQKFIPVDGQKQTPFDMADEEPESDLPWDTKP